MSAILKEYFMYNGIKYRIQCWCNLKMERKKSKNEKKILKKKNQKKKNAKIK